MDDEYELLDSGNGQKLERFGKRILARPAAQAVWDKTLSSSRWQSADGIFTREKGNRWIKPVSGPWECQIASLRFQLAATDFGHVGVFPEQAPFWEWMQGVISDSGNKQVQVLNLFAYSGGATLVCAKAGAHVCHLDSSKGMISWAKENAAWNRLHDAPIRWMADDAKKFLAREEKRGNRYDAIILDPPTFGRGTKGEVFKIEEEIVPLLQACRRVLKPNPLFLLFSSHTPHFSPLVMHHLFTSTIKPEGGSLECGEMAIAGNPTLPSGTFARWQRD